MAVRAYGISTIVDTVASVGAAAAAVRAYRISTIVDFQEVLCPDGMAVRAYRISTIVDQLVRNVDNIVQKEYTSNIVDALQFLNLGIHAVYIYCNGPKYN